MINVSERRKWRMTTRAGDNIILRKQRIVKERAAELNFIFGKRIFYKVIIRLRPAFWNMKKTFVCGDGEISKSYQQKDLFHFSRKQFASCVASRMASLPGDITCESSVMLMLSINFLRSMNTSAEVEFEAF